MSTDFDPFRTRDDDKDWGSSKHSFAAESGSRNLSSFSNNSSQFSIPQTGQLRRSHSGTSTISSYSLRPPKRDTAKIRDPKIVRKNIRDGDSSAKSSYDETFCESSHTQSEEVLEILEVQEIDPFDVANDMDESNSIPEERYDIAQIATSGPKNQLGSDFRVMLRGERGNHRDEELSTVISEQVSDQEDNDSQFFASGRANITKITKSQDRITPLPFTMLSPAQSIESSNTETPINSSFRLDGNSLTQFLWNSKVDLERKRPLSDEMSANQSESDFKVHGTESPWRKRAILIAIVLSVLLLSAILAIVAIFLKKTRRRADSNRQDEELDMRIQNLLQEFKPLSGDDVFDDDGSPQSLALRWLASEELFDSTVSQQRYAAAVLYFSFDVLESGQSMDGWMRGQIHECEWSPSLQCRNQKVTGIQLSGDGLQGLLPREIALLTNLESVILRNNTLVGTIPTELGLLSNLKVLVLEGNRLTGRVPSQLGKISRLKALELSRNLLRGGIPSTLAELRSLRMLDLSFNILQGTFPEMVGNALNLRTLNLRNNRFRGTIPENTLSMKNLDNLILDYNRFTGTLPSFKLVGCKKTVSLSGNHFQGPITVPTPANDPSYRIETLILSQNFLTGQIPTELAQITSLKYLDLGNNIFTGRASGFPGSRIKTVILSSNRLNEAVPEEYGVQLQTVDFSFNSLTGTIPVQLGDLRDLERLDLSNNPSMAGEIPRAVSLPRKLNTLNLFRCGLTGKVPHDLGFLSNLKLLNLDGNNLTGMLPKSLCRNEVQSFNFSVPCSVDCNCCANHCTTT